MWARVKSGHRAEVRTMQWELVGSLPEVSEACWEFAGSSSNGSKAHWEFAGSLSKISKACCEFAGSMPKIMRSLPRWHREFIGRRPRDSPESHQGLLKSLSRVRRVLLDLIIT
ncbi:hypothetical protein B296_00017434 [Ensete ventricosum]|uniref:Uncharacterized protein n=1 Tax=Ensete ventricosum TaxID=4639 RepID=A0A426ZUV2_ENSVE|nr:hypothetical protein B296_00017434 [Ensete ventricosum]